MADVITIDTRSPERAWEPFMVWLREQDIEPERTRAVSVDPEAMVADVTFFKLRDGKRYVVRDEMATEVRRVPVSSLPPRRFA